MNRRRYVIQIAFLYHGKGEADTTEFSVVAASIEEACRLGNAAIEGMRRANDELEDLTITRIETSR